MRIALAGVASLLLIAGCSSSPSASHSSLNGATVAVSDGWARTIARQFASDPRQLPPAVQPPGPSLRHDGDSPASPRTPGCLLCPTAFAAHLDPEGWQLAGRPDPVDVANALGAPSLAASIADRITDAEIALAEVAAADRSVAESIVQALAADLDGLAQLL